MKIELSSDETIEEFESQIIGLALSEFLIFLFSKVNKLSDKTAREVLWDEVKLSASRDVNLSSQIPLGKVLMTSNRSDRMLKAQQIQFMKGLKPKPKPRVKK
jgi:hypothetical protein